MSESDYEELKLISERLDAFRLKHNFMTIEIKSENSRTNDRQIIIVRNDSFDDCYYCEINSNYKSSYEQFCKDSGESRGNG